MSQLIECLYCRKPGPCSTVEHPVPESLGHGNTVLEGIVCDGCQNYLAIKVENPALNHTAFGFWRAHLSIPTKKGRLPSSDTRPPSAGGVIPTCGGRNQPGFTISASDDGIPGIKFHSDDGLIVSDDGTDIQYTVKLTPWHLDVMSRFLAKMALGTLSYRDRASAMDSKYDELRAYARFGTPNRLWPVFLGRYGRLDELFTGHRMVGDGLVFEARLPSWQFLPIDSDTLFVFWIGTDLYVLNMNSRSTDCPIAIGEPLEPPKCLWYSPEQIRDGGTPSSTKL